MVSVPVFDGLLTERRSAEADAKLAAARSGTEALKRTVATQVLQALQDVESSHEQTENSLAQLDQAQEALNMAKVQYDIGVGTNLEYLDSQTSLELAKLNNLGATYRDAGRHPPAHRAEPERGPRGVRLRRQLGRLRHLHAAGSARCPRAAAPAPTSPPPPPSPRGPCGWAVRHPRSTVGEIWLATGNGTSGSTYDGSDSVIELSPGLTKVQFFAPTGWQSQNGSDADLGSTAPALLSNGTVLQVGKSSTAYQLEQAALGGISTPPSPRRAAATPTAGTPSRAPWSTWRATAAWRRSRRPRARRAWCGRTPAPPSHRSRPAGSCGRSAAPRSTV